MYQPASVASYSNLPASDKALPSSDDPTFRPSYRSSYNPNSDNILSSQNYIDTEKIYGLSQNYFSKPFDSGYTEYTTTLVAPKDQGLASKPVWSDHYAPLFMNGTSSGVKEEEIENSRAEQKRKDNFELYFENKQLKDDIQKLKEEGETMTKENQRLSGELEMIGRGDNAGKKQQDRVKILQSLNSNLKLEVEMVHLELANEKHKVQALERQIDSLKGEMSNYNLMRDKELLAYKNLLNELHHVKSQLSVIRKGPSEMFKNTTTQGRIKLLEQEKAAREKEIQTLRMQMQHFRQPFHNSSKQPSKGQQMISNLQGQIGQIKEQASRRGDVPGRNASEDKMIKSYRLAQEQEIYRLKREINKKRVQAQQMQEELLKLEQ